MVSISVLMPTYNTELSMLKEAVESILNQTFQDFEFIIIDDGSTNESPAYLETLADPRIRIIRNDTNQGIAKSLNRGLRMAKGKYIARMDSDDISLPTRFEIQYSYMESHPDVIACGTKIGQYDNIFFSPKSVHEEMEYYRVKLLFSNPGPIHPTVFINREKLIQFHIEYDEGLLYAQDYGLWATICQYGQISFLPDKLIEFRSHPNRVTLKYRDKQIACHKITLKKLLSGLIDDVSDAEVDFHYMVTMNCYRSTPLASDVNEWCEKLMLANEKRRIYDPTVLRYCIEEMKIRLVRHTFTNEMPAHKKISLLFRNIPFGTVCIFITKTTIQRLGRFLRQEVLQQSKQKI